MVKAQRTRLLAGGGALLAVALYFWMRPSAPVPEAPPPAAAARRRGAAPEARVQPIGLDRLAAIAPAEPAVQRDLFAFGQLPAPPQTEAPPPPVTTAEALPTPETLPTPPPLPPLNVKFIGSLEVKPGPRVAFFQTEKKDIVTGQVGEVVMNRFKIVKIGYESADIQEVGVDQVRRLPLRGGS